MEEASGTRYDIIGSNNLEEQGITVPSATGKNYDAAFFDANHASEDKFSAVDHTSISPNSTVALSIWVKVENGVAVVNGGGVYGKGLSYQLSITQTTFNGSSTGFILAFTLRQSDSTPLLVQVNLPAGVFHNCLGIADGSNMVLYLDGVNVASMAYDGTIYDSTEPFVVSSLNDIQYTCDHYIDELAVWKDLTFATDKERADFATALYNGGDGMFWDDNINNWDACVEYASSDSSSSIDSSSSSSSSA